MSRKLVKRAILVAALSLAATGAILVATGRLVFYTYPARGCEYAIRTESGTVTEGPCFRKVGWILR